MEKTNNMYAQPKFKCGICGKIYDDIKGRNTCEAVCLKKQEEEAKRAAEAKKKEEQEARYKEVTDAYDRFNELLKKYTHDYGTFIMNGTDIPTFNKLLDHFWF